MLINRRKHSFGRTISNDIVAVSPQTATVNSNRKQKLLNKGSGVVYMNNIFNSIHNAAITELSDNNDDSSEEGLASRPGAAVQKLR
jgi:hypothetical protein